MYVKSIFISVDKFIIFFPACDEGLFRRAIRFQKGPGADARRPRGVRHDRAHPGPGRQGAAPGMGRVRWAGVKVIEFDDQRGYSSVFST